MKCVSFLFYLFSQKLIKMKEIEKMKETENKEDPFPTCEVLFDYLILNYLLYRI